MYAYVLVKDILWENVNWEEKNKTIVLAEK